MEVGHGNGLGACSLQIGRPRLDDTTTLTTVREALTSSQMGVLIASDRGTSKDLAAAVRHSADIARVAAHCIEADVAERHLGVVRDLDAETQGVLLMSHMAAPDEPAEQCALMVMSGAQAIGIMDSADHYLPTDVTERVQAIAAAVDVPVICHGHHNLGLAAANSPAALDAGASVIDATARGFGAGAGNTQFEVLAAVLERRGIHTRIGLHEILAAADGGRAR